MAFLDMIKRLTAAGMALSLAACATQFGHDFNGKATMDLVPGASTRTEALAVLGPPRNTRISTLKKDMAGRKLAQPLVIEDLDYYYRDVNAPGTAIDKEAKRYAWVIFAGEKLLSYSVASTFQRDATDFDEKKVRQLVRGTSTQGDARMLLGAPSGRAIYPAARDIGGTRWTYWVRWWNGDKMHAKTLTIDFDAALVVTDFDLQIGSPS